MALGLNYEAAQSADITPIVKLDAKAGRAFRIDREDGENTPVDITANFKAVMDLENIEIGWISFSANTAPDFRMVPVGQDKGLQPSDQHKPGLRLLCKLARECGGDIREIAVTAKVSIQGFDKLHNQYLAAPESKQGKLPVVVLEKTIPVTSGEGSRKTTNYMAVWKIVFWVARPADLMAKPRGGGNGVHAHPKDNAARASSNSGTGRPSTGSTVVKAPAAQEPSQEEDFG